MLRGFYPEIENYDSFMLDVGDGHALYVEQCGNPKGIPVVFLHGGPGGFTKPKHRRFFNPKKYRIILFHQRGCGLSVPQGSLHKNTTAHLVADLEKIRKTLDIDKWVLFGGSWGSTLAIAYAAKHGANMLGAIIFGVFMGRKSETFHFMHKDGMAAHIYPEAYAKLLSILTASEKRDPLASYAKILENPKNKRRAKAARHWIEWECALYIMDRSPPEETKRYLDEGVKSGTLLINALFEASYISHNCYLNEKKIFSALKKLRRVPCTIIQGRLDLVCPPQTAFDVHKAWPKSTLKMLPHEGHANDTPAMLDALITATNEMALKI